MSICSVNSAWLYAMGSSQSMSFRIEGEMTDALPVARGDSHTLIQKKRQSGKTEGVRNEEAATSKYVAYADVQEVEGLGRRLFSGRGAGETNIMVRPGPKNPNKKDVYFLDSTSNDDNVSIVSKSSSSSSSSSSSHSSSSSSSSRSFTGEGL